MRTSTRLFRLGSLGAVQDKVSFLDAPPGVIGMLIDDTAGIPADPLLHAVLVIFNATPASVIVSAPGAGWGLHPVQASGFDSIVKMSTVSFGCRRGSARTTAVFVR